MKKLFMLAALIVTLAQFDAITQGAEGAQPGAGMPLKSHDGHSLGVVYKPTEDGGVKVIVDGKMIVLPAGTISVEHGTVTTSLSKSDVYRLR